jgi:hypothetical protein
VRFNDPGNFRWIVPFYPAGSNHSRAGLALAPGNSTDVYDIGQGLSKDVVSRSIRKAVLADLLQSLQSRMR